MRRLIIVTAILATCCSPWAMAAPQQRLSGRLKQYDEPFEQPPSRRIRAGAGATRATRQVGYQDAQRGGYQDAQPAAYQEAESVPYEAGPSAGPAGPFADEWQGGPWSNGPGACGDCGDDWCGWPRCGTGFWGRAEYLYWWVRGSETPPLVTTSPDNTPQPQAGVLPDATVLFGNERVNASGRSGGRFTLGYCFNDCNQTGLESTFLFLGRVDQDYFNSSGGSPILARPLFNVLTPAQDAHLIAYPDIVIGSVLVQNTSRVFGGDVNVRRTLFADCYHRFDVLAGYRYFQLAENLQVNTNTTSIDPQSPIEVGTKFAIFDSFATRNNFNGGQLGINMQFVNGPWVLDVLTKLAVGSVSQRIIIDGGTVTTVPNELPSSATGGILALGSNIGTYQRNRFAVLPELGVDLRYQLTPLWRLNLGYTLMALTNVARPGDSVNLRVDPSQFPPSSGGTQPRFVFHDSDVWLQGINFGLECNF